MEWPLEILMGDMSCREEKESSPLLFPSLGVVISGNYKWAPLQLEKEEEAAAEEQERSLEG